MIIFSATKKIISFSILFFMLAIGIQPAHIIFDMDGVVVKQSRFSACWTIGLTKFLGIYNPFALDQKLFDFLDKLEPRRNETPKAMHRGRLLPQIMCDWLSGEKTNAEIRLMVEQGLERFDNFFYSSSQQALIAAMCEFMFTPEKLVNAFYPVKDTLKLAKKCAKRRDKFDNQNFVYILTNWDAESFTLFYKLKKFKKLFSRCKGIIVSGTVNLIKPDFAIFDYFIKQYSIDPAKELTVLIDDTPGNVQAAKDCGLYGILCHKLNIHGVKKELREIGVL